MTDSKKFDDGGHAYPIPPVLCGTDVAFQPRFGMSLWDHYAGLAMAVLLGKDWSSARTCGWGSPEGSLRENNEVYSYGGLLADEAMDIADAMIAERRRRKDAALPEKESFLNEPLSAVNFNVRTINALKWAKVLTVKQLLGMSHKQLRKLRGIGAAGICDIDRKLEVIGLYRISMDSPSWTGVKMPNKETGA
jgi:hypothetical protein